jgi:hypothetical protein
MGGFILWQGASLLDGAPIVVIATTKTENRKTGNMVQTWILRSDIDPVAAAKTGADASICGDCPQRWFLKGQCYVNLGQAPLAVFRAFQRGAYTPSNPADVGAGRAVRIGSYGDPAAAPVSIWDAFLSRARKWTGYTHQWRRPEFSALARFCMASTESEEAAPAGWRTFRVRAATTGLLRGEAMCPASTEGGAKLQCVTCGACNGTATGRRGNIAIVAH